MKSGKASWKGHLNQPRKKQKPPQEGRQSLETDIQQIPEGFGSSSNLPPHKRESRNHKSRTHTTDVGSFGNFFSSF